MAVISFEEAEVPQKKSSPLWKVIHDDDDDDEQFVATRPSAWGGGPRTTRQAASQQTGAIFAILVAVREWVRLVYEAL